MEKGCLLQKFLLKSRKKANSEIFNLWPTSLYFLFEGKNSFSLNGSPPFQESKNFWTYFSTDPIFGWPIAKPFSQWTKVHTIRTSIKAYLGYSVFFAPVSKNIENRMRTVIECAVENDLWHLASAAHADNTHKRQLRLMVARIVRPLSLTN